MIFKHKTIVVFHKNHSENFISDLNCSIYIYIYIFHILYRLALFIIFIFRRHVRRLATHSSGGDDVAGAAVSNTHGWLAGWAGNNPP